MTGYDMHIKDNGPMAAKENWNRNSDAALVGTSLRIKKCFQRSKKILKIIFFFRKVA
jgi:hypothetical protein